MFLLNFIESNKTNFESNNLQYKMFLLNTDKAWKKTTFTQFTIQNVPIK